MKPFFLSISFRLGHVSDETLASLLSGELGSYRTLRVIGHLNRCWACRLRREELERAALLVVEYRRGNQALCLPLDPDHRRTFLARVEEAMNAPGAVSPWPRLILPLRRHLRAMNPVFASAVVIAVAGVLLLWIWQRSATTVSAQELLRRAEATEQRRSLEHPNSLLYQQVSVRAGTFATHHAIYRDLSGRRHARPVTLSPAETRVRRVLENAGVDWEQPLSAEDFHSWRDRQAQPHDDVERSGPSELTLTTTISSGDVTQESLTVRESDFHPIRRVVELRNQETIEVAELDFAVLGWSAVNQALFEPFAEASSSTAAVPALHAGLPHLLPTPLQLDVAELAARASLAQLRQDAGDQIRITRSDTGIAVKGIVTTNDRKRELLTGLHGIAYVHAQFLSTEEMQEGAVRRTPSTPNNSSSSSPQFFTSSDVPAPLAKFLSGRQAQPQELSTASREILEACLRVQHAGAQLLELQNRFISAASLPDTSRMQLESLIAAQRAQVLNGLDAESAAMAHVGLLSDEGPRSATATGKISLAQLIAQNQQFCQELITAPIGEPRTASAVAADIESSISQIRATTAETSNTPQP